MKKKRNIYLAILTLITIIFWVLIGVYQVYNKSTLTVDVVQALTPLDPKIDETVFSVLKDRHEYWSNE